MLEDTLDTQDTPQILMKPCKAPASLYRRGFQGRGLFLPRQRDKKMPSSLCLCFRWFRVFYLQAHRNSSRCFFDVGAFFCKYCYIISLGGAVLDRESQGHARQTAAFSSDRMAALPLLQIMQMSLHHLLIFR